MVLKAPLNLEAFVGALQNKTPGLSGFIGPHQGGGGM